MVVYHHWSVEWHPRSDPPGGLLRVVVVADDADGDAPPDGAWSDDPVYRARRRLLRWIMRSQCPIPALADRFAVEHFRDHPAYFGLLGA